MKKKTLIIAIGALVAVIALFLVLFFCLKPQAGKGVKNVTVIVVAGDGTEKTYEVTTEAEMVVDVLKEMVDDPECEFTVDASHTTFGTYIDAINGELADFAADGAYWAIYVNGQFGEYGVDQQPVNDGDVFSFIYEVFVMEE